MRVVDSTLLKGYPMADFFTSDGEYKAVQQGGFLARMIADSVSPGGARLSTFELTFPRMVLSEFNTHRLLSRNSASSRAIPVTKQIQKLITDPFIPAPGTVLYNQPGMQGKIPLSDEDYQEFVKVWKSGRSRAILTSLELILGVREVSKSLGRGYSAFTDVFEGAAAEDYKQGVIEALDEYTRFVKQAREAGEEQTRYLDIHKQTANRVVEPYMWHVVIASATEWDNFWYLRDHEEADPQIHTIASLAHKLYEESVPEQLELGEWHLPFVRSEEKHLAAQDIEKWKGISTGRAARVSYETHDGRRNPEADVRLYERLISDPPHLSPPEHVGTPLADPDEWSGNFKGFFQHRKEIQASRIR